MALIEMKVILAHIISNFEITLKHDAKLIMTTKPIYGIKYDDLIRFKQI
jgi:hypothetical protein